LILRLQTGKEKFEMEIYELPPERPNAWREATADEERVMRKISRLYWGGELATFQGRYVVMNRKYRGSRFEGTLAECEAWVDREQLIEAAREADETDEAEALAEARVP
jgi:hypothetical protein